MSSCLFISAQKMLKFKRYIIIPSSETFEKWVKSQGLFLELPMSSTSCGRPFFLWHLPLELSVSLSLTGLMRWQHRGHPLLYCSLFMLNLNVLSVPGHYLTPCPWAAAASLFNSPRWQEVRDCSELLSHRVRETLPLSPPPLCILVFCPPPSLLTPFSASLRSDSGW